MKIRFAIYALFALLAAVVCAEDPSEKNPQNSAEDEQDEAVTADMDAGFERYKSIIDRQPFGPPPPGFDPSLPAGQAGAAGAEEGGEKTEAEISAEEQKLLSSVRVSILNVTPSGTVMAGFTDSTTQPPVNYYLKVGDTSTDSAKWTVKDADPAAGTVTLSKDGVDVTLAVGGETKKGSPVGKGATAKGAPQQQQRRPFFNGRRLTPPQATEEDDDEDGAVARGGALANLRKKRKMKHDKELAEEKARAAKEAEEKEEKEEQRLQAEEQRAALFQIQEELRRQREANAAKPQNATDE